MSSSGIDHLRIGEVSIYRIADLDGIVWSPSAMFDAPPDELDALMRAAPPDSVDLATRQIRLSFNSYLVRMPDAVVLIDCGVGNDKERAGRPVWHRRRGDFLDRLVSIGVAPGDIDIVVNTHLHADHVGWNTVLRDGHWVPAFPKARYVVGDRELRHWRALDDADSSGGTLHGSFADSVRPLLRAGVMESRALPCEIAPRMTLEPAFGHSPGMAVVRLATAGPDVLFLADAIHHPLQMGRPRLGTNFCEDPAQACETRLALLDRCATETTIVAPYHFPAPGFGRIVRAGHDYAFRALE